MLGQALDIAVVLKEGARNVQRKIGAVDYTLQKHQKFRDDFLDIVRDKHLTVEQLDFSVLPAEIFLDARKIQNTLEVKGIIHVQMHPEKRVLIGAEKFLIGRLVLVVRAVLGVSEPQRMDFIDGLFFLLWFFRVVMAAFARIAVFVFLGRLVLWHVVRVFVVVILGLCFGVRFFLAQIFQIDRHGHIAAIAVEHFAHARAVQKFLFILHDVERHGGAARLAAALLHGERHAVVAFPDHGRGPVLP